MISVEFFVNQINDLAGFKICGHSGKSENGTDIICAAVSSAVYMTANIITEILHIHATVVVEANGGFLLKIQETDQMACKDILTGLKLHLLELKNQYPENILINYTEVK
ncbi:MAG: ribosomal-processing cysteine protease Prp [Oscillospiraceae bacterium]|jgi:uncharacterized protein YsxB (DUF464 family)|nr:ribosomal-processing cysteine protease Prp [Oscillospiraceae bacterium]